MREVTELLNAIEKGKPSASDELLPLVYDELRRLAAQRLAMEPSGQTLQATALVHEAFIRMVDQKEAREWDSRGHFFAAAADSMRRILIDNARRKQALKRGGDRQRVQAEMIEFTGHSADDDILALDEALKQFADVDERAARIVELRYFAGLTMEEAAQTLKVSLATAKRDWAYARAWLNDELSKE